MLIIDECGVLKYIKELAQKDFNCERCAIAIAEVVVCNDVCKYILCDYCMLEDVGGKTNECVSIIPQKVSYSLLNICKKSRRIPAIIHTHILGYDYSMPLSFSPQDMLFIEKFSQYASKMVTVTDCIFIVTNGDDTSYCLINLKNMKYYFKEELSDDQNKI